jgi:hypothetical protein
METLYFTVAGNQVATQGRNPFFTAIGAATVDIPGLERLNGASVVSSLHVTGIGAGGAEVQWQSNHSLSRNLRVESEGGTVVKTVVQDYSARHHKVMINGLKSATPYTVTVSGTDPEGRPATPATAKFRTLEDDNNTVVTADAWLQVRVTSRLSPPFLPSC